MQIPLKNRETISGAVTVFTSVVDASNMPAFTVTLIGHVIAGTAPSLSVQMQTSEDLETWLDAAVAVSLIAPGVSSDVCRADTAVYGRYVRAEIETIGADSVANYSLYLDLFPSS